MPYMQGALALDGAAPPDQQRERPFPLTPMAALPQRSGWTTTLRHTLTPSARRLPGSLWEEYRCECATRLRLRLPPVGLAEFADMRDWTDGTKENDDDDPDCFRDPDLPPDGSIAPPRR